MSVQVAVRVRPLLATEQSYANCGDVLHVVGSTVSVDVTVLEGFVSQHEQQEAFSRTNTAPHSSWPNRAAGRKSGLSPASYRSISPQTARQYSSSSPLHDLHVLRSARSIVRSSTPTNRLTPRHSGGSGGSTRCPVFRFDSSFTAADTQDAVYDHLCSPLVGKLLEGYNCCLLAYGQTGSGKTYTMLGPHEEELGGRGSYSARLRVRSAESRGIILRSAEDLLHRIHSLRDTDVSATGSIGQRAQLATAIDRDRSMFEVSVTFVQVVRERIWCLLGDGMRPVRPREVASGMLLEGALNVRIASIADVEAVVDAALARRLRGTSLQNIQSSRSHAVLAFHVRCIRSSVARSFESSIQLVDLAGSERIGRNNTSSGPDGVCSSDYAMRGTPRRATIEDGSDINQSLTALGKVIQSLAAKEAHVPYRDSILTFLLKNSFGGNAHTTMLATVSPSLSCLEESLSTLRYCSRARDIVNSPRVNAASEQTKQVIDLLQGEVDELRHQLSSVSATALSAELALDLREKERLLAKYEQDQRAADDLRRRWEVERCSLTARVEQLERDAGELRDELDQARRTATTYEQKLKELAALGGDQVREDVTKDVRAPVDDIRAILRRKPPARNTTCLPWPITVVTTSGTIPSRYDWVLDSSTPSANPTIAAVPNNVVKQVTPPPLAGGTQREASSSSSSGDDIDDLSPEELRAAAARAGINVPLLLANSSQITPRTPPPTTTQRAVVPVLRFAPLVTDRTTQLVGNVPQRRLEHTAHSSHFVSRRASPQVARPPLHPAFTNANPQQQLPSAPPPAVVSSSVTQQAVLINPAVKTFREKLRNQSAPSLRKVSSCLSEAEECLNRTLRTVENRVAVELRKS